MRRDRCYFVTPGFDTAFGGAFQGRRVLVTGHTGFMGSWLALWLRMLGAQVSGLALPAAPQPNHWQLLNLNIDEVLADLRDAEGVRNALQRLEPELVFHLAAQPLVRRGYREPMDTWGTNLMGLLHLFEAVRATPSVRAVVNITSDKVYESTAARHPYRELDALGGLDPYSTSKACAERLSASYRACYFSADDGRGHGVGLATVRSGNVLGGGDWNEDRLLPDLVRGITHAHATPVRNPAAVRPWQHVLEPLSGCLLVAQALLADTHAQGEAWNFGPPAQSHLSVGELIARLQAHWPAIRTAPQPMDQPHEQPWLALDCSKAQAQLGWRAVWDIETTLQRTAQWYRSLHTHGEVCSADDLRAYLEDARALQLAWAGG